MSENFLTTCDGAALRITINRPEEGNAMTDGMADELASLIDGASAKVHCIVVKGAGEHFCKGRASHGRYPMVTTEALDVRRGSNVIFNCYDAFRRSPIPVICAVEGEATGFGCGLAAMGDITIASSNAQFQMPEFGHNIMPTMALSAILRKVNLKSAMYIAYSTATLSADRACAIGLVNEVVKQGELNAAVDRIVSVISKAPLPAIIAIKEYAHNAPDMSMRGAVEYARNLHATINSSNEMKKKH
jgi:enoyl-CoA hydratase